MTRLDFSSTVEVSSDCPPVMTPMNRRAANAPGRNMLNPATVRRSLFFVTVTDATRPTRTIESMVARSSDRALTRALMIASRRPW